MKKRLISKLFVSTFIVIILSFSILYIVQDFTINKLYVNNKMDKILLHFDKSYKYLNEKQTLKLNNRLIKELETSPYFNKSYVQLYSVDWTPQLSWINPQLVSPYYIEHDNDLYKLGVDKYTNIVYQKDLILYNGSKNDAYKKIENNNFDNMHLKTIWRYKGSEIVYLVPNNDGTVSLKIFDFDKPLNNDNFESSLIGENIKELNKISEIKGTIIKEFYRNQIDVGYGYMNKFMSIKTNSFIINNTSFKYDEKTIIRDIDEYTGVKYSLIIRPLVIEDKLYRLVYFNTFDNLVFLNPLDTKNKAILLTSILISSIIALVYSMKISKPILEIKNVTHYLSKLDFSRRCNIKTGDEIELLAKDINLMAQELESNKKRLEEELLKLKQIENFRKLFITAASHEFRTPLTIMKGIIEGYQDNVYDNENKDPLKLMEFEISELEKIVHEIITISKSEANAMRYNYTHFQLSDIVQVNLNRYKYILNTRNIKINKVLEDGFIYADEEKISLVIKNVLSNAIKYSPYNNSINIRVLEKEDKMVLTVENSGKQVDEEIMDLIWEPFFRVGNQQEKIPGFGIGLYTSKIILEDHKSNFHLRNTEKGVLFYCDFEKIENI